MRTGLFISLCLWGAGVQVNEVLGSVGEAGTLIFALLMALAERELPWRQVLIDWWPLWTFWAWTVVAPALALRLPTATGLARAGDWLVIPVAGYAWRAIPPSSRGWAMKIWGGTMAISCAVAALQHFGVWPPLDAFQAFRWTHVPFERVYERVPGSADLFMGGGLLFHRLKFAHVTSLVVIAALALGLSAQARWRWWALGVAAFGFLSVISFSYARAASAALALSCLVAVAASRLRRKAFAALTVAIAVAMAGGFLGSPSLRRRFLSSNTSEGTGDRATILAIGLRAVREHPVRGAGLGRFRPSYFAPQGTPTHILENAGKAHNQFLSMAAEVGIPGAALFILLLAWLFSRFNRETIEGRAGVAVLTFFVLLSLVHDPLVQAPFSMALSLALGIGLSSKRRSTLSTRIAENRSTSIEPDILPRALRVRDSNQYPQK